MKLFNLSQSASTTPSIIFNKRETIIFKGTQEGARKSEDGQLENT